MNKTNEAALQRCMRQYAFAMDEGEDSQALHMAKLMII